MTFEPGKSGNPNGYKGPRDRARRQVFEMIEGLGLIDSLQILCTIANDVNTDPSIRVAAAAASVNHFHPKLQSVPTPRFIEESIQLPFPEPKTLEQANANIAYLSAHKAQGLISIDSADSLIGDNQSVVNNLIVEEELKFKLYPPEHQDQRIVISGGLPTMPGLEGVLMPQLNGHTADARALAAPVDAVPNPSDLKAQGPHPLQEHHFKDSGQNPSTGNGQEPS